MRLQLRQNAGENEVFAPNAFASQIGKEVPFTVEGTSYGRATLIAADVIEQGRAVLLTIEKDGRIVGDYSADMSLRLAADQ